MPPSTKVQMSNIASHLVVAAQQCLTDPEPVARIEAWWEGFSQAIGSLSTERDTFPSGFGATLVAELQQYKNYAVPLLQNGKLRLDNLPNAPRLDDGLCHANESLRQHLPIFADRLQYLIDCREAKMHLAQLDEAWRNHLYTMFPSARTVTTDMQAYTLRHFGPVATAADDAIFRFRYWTRAGRRRVCHVLKLLETDFHDKGERALVLNVHKPLVQAIDWAKQHTQAIERERRRQVTAVFEALRAACLAYRPSPFTHGGETHFQGLSEHDTHAARELGHIQFDAFASHARPLVLHGLQVWDQTGYEDVFKALQEVVESVSEYGGTALESPDDNHVPAAIRAADARVDQSHTSRPHSPAHSHPSTSYSLGQLHRRQQVIYGVSQAAFARRLAARGMRSF
ncbi:hypothetical protein JCM10207_001431 [Rhodosporidiobolus poonsookiae]